MYSESFGGSSLDLSVYGTVKEGLASFKTNCNVIQHSNIPVAKRYALTLFVEMI